MQLIQMMSLLGTWLLFLSLSDSGFATARDCPGPTPDSYGYNFEPLLSEDIWVIHDQPCNFTADPSNTDCSFYFTFCQPLTGLHSNCSKASACMVDDTNGETTNIGDATTFRYENRNSFFSTGEFAISYTVAEDKRITALVFFCNQSVSWLDRPSQNNESLAWGLIGKVISGYDDLVDMQFYYDGACFTPTGISTLSGGAIFAILLVVFIVIYVVGGLVLNIGVRGKEGAEAFPNYNTWLTVGTFIRDKVFCGCGSGGSASGGSGGDSGEAERLVNDEAAPFAKPSSGPPSGGGGSAGYGGTSSTAGNAYDAL